MIEAAGRALVGKLGTTPKIKDVKTVVGNHSVSCDTAVYIPGCVGGTLLTCCLILVQQ